MLISYTCSWSNKHWKLDMLVVIEQIEKCVWKVHNNWHIPSLGMSPPDCCSCPGLEVICMHQSLFFFSLPVLHSASWSFFISNQLHIDAFFCFSEWTSWRQVLFPPPVLHSSCFFVKGRTLFKWTSCNFKKDSSAVCSAVDRPTDLSLTTNQLHLCAMP